MGSPEPTTPVVSMSPALGPDDVHGAALTLAGALGPAEHLGQQGPERDPLGDLVVETPVGGDEIVVGPQGGGEARRRWLPGPGVSSRPWLPSPRSRAARRASSQAATSAIVR